ncbi:uncharacterized protein K441DRAFT_669516 [Cenococcum geophilum 1.58]|uniref:Uncharacterized protein n=1 Tax=Cenococcum geophilum 1.58 TaxID=794803 RepID=A0ACC8EQ09_9PEZI|nr:hypothetical protein K441DRAFT_669516 [Cenococcum geophilum 1.58]
MESAECGDITTYGNKAGLDLLEERQEMKEMMKRMEGWMVSKDAESKRLEDRMADKDAQSKRFEDRMANKDIQIKRLEDQMAKKDTQIANHQARITESRAQITSLQNHVQSLTADAGDITILGIDLSMSIAEMSGRTLLRKYVPELGRIIKKPMRVMWLSMHSFVPCAVKASNRYGPCANTKTSTRVSTIESIL